MLCFYCKTKKKKNFFLVKINHGHLGRGKCKMMASLTKLLLILIKIKDIVHILENLIHVAIINVLTPTFQRTFGCTVYQAILLFNILCGPVFLLSSSLSLLDSPILCLLML